MKFIQFQMMKKSNFDWIHLIPREYSVLFQVSPRNTYKHGKLRKISYSLCLLIDLRHVDSCCYIAIAHICWLTRQCEGLFLGGGGVQKVYHSKNRNIWPPLMAHLLWSWRKLSFEGSSFNFLRSWCWSSIFEHVTV